MKITILEMDYIVGFDFKLLYCCLRQQVNLGSIILSSIFILNYIYFLFKSTNWTAITKNI